ncbi:spore germination protein GerW family protein [Gottfriedia sp. NPDC056225]|uniref:spore germination protein GerW family protein n=1 Tax=Gottfriedia sp. NPDC056225 TaxID=3345751 RepID=UPI0035DF636E
MKDWFEEFEVEISNEIKDLVSSNTLIGDPILYFDKIILIPFFEMIVVLGEAHSSFEFASVGTGVEVIPKAFLVIMDGKTDVILVNNKNMNLAVSEKILDVTF